ncbi:hypothetical protein H072_7998 [Dactylellina haptotyla CBS 200.50]|uniref:L-type lectin-like domain-containing protein n=1 Tax=Dactylellina haptotyla (strain CBS 200.50) TaxID=1284197 RepID=S8A6D6_DACHA|nr:hypothetical protein H072_7998 [Dactylellina haptotyla CBS 200.50]
MLKSLCRSLCAVAALCSLAFNGQASADEHDGYKTVPLRTHSLYQPYLDSDLQSRWFDFGGTTIIRADQYIRMTSDRQHQTGWLWSRLPLTATNWEIEFEFRIHGDGHLHGDGFAFWVTKDRATAGPVFGSVNKFDGLGIFFDTYKNNRPGVIFPYVMAMLGDGHTDYDHDTDGKEQELGGCSARGIRAPNMASRAKVTYFQEKFLSLELQYKQPDSWTTCFHVPNVTLPAVGYLGFSAQTGELSDNHDIITIAARNLYTSPTAPNTDSGKKGKKKASKDGYPSYDDRHSAEGGGWGWFFIKLVLWVCVLVGGYVGYTLYRAQQRQSRF